MKKIGILFGRENTFPPALIERINSKKVAGIVAEPVKISMVKQAEEPEYAVILDRISQDVPFYRSYLKNAAAMGTAVINNPFWWSADEKFFNNVLAEKIGVPVPKTVILPSHHRPDDTTEESFRNLSLPLDWEGMVEYIGGFPAFMKPHAGGGWKSVYKVHNMDEMFQAHSETGQLVMMLQEAIDFTDYFRCYCIGQKHVHIMPYEPRNPFHERYLRKTTADYDPEIIKTVHDYVLKINEALGYDFNTVELAVRDGIPYAIDFCNPAPDADDFSVGPDNFEWVIENMANYLIERAQQQVPGEDNLSWGSYVRDAAGMPAAKPAKKAAPKKKAAPTKKAAPKKKESKADTLARIADKAKNIDFDRIGRASADEKDDLKKIKGIGPFLEEKLNSLGIYTFQQIANFKAKDEELVNDAIEFFPGRIKRDNWKKQAKGLAK
jgi:predicted flap endonuclease-1-like 5' DNA nuclease